MKKLIAVITKDHELIQQWARQRGAKPVIKDAYEQKELRFNFPDRKAASAQEVSWDQFFKVFDQEHYEFLFEDVTKSSHVSRFAKFIKEEEEEYERHEIQEEEAGYSSDAFITRDHELIQEWAEQRATKPCVIRSTRQGESGLLRLKFPDELLPEAFLEEISWDEFFEIFERNKLEFLFQEFTRDGQVSRFSKFIKGL